jgi:DNA-binding LytR/AlgR family response regulator
MQVAVCDDNELFLREIHEQLLSLQIVEDIFLFSDIQDFLLSVKNRKIYDAVLMDIDFEDDSTGIDAAGELYKLCPKTKIIYATGNIEYSQKIFLQRANLSGFLTKPVDLQLLQANLQKVIDAAALDEEPTLMLKQGGTAIYVPLREIFFIESKGHTIEAHTQKEVITSYERLNNIMPALPEGFYQCPC